MREFVAIRRKAAGQATLVMAVVAAAGFLGSWAIARDGFNIRARYLDTPRYATYGRWLRDGRTPYRDFSVEYPPLALPAFVLPELLAGDGVPFVIALPGRRGIPALALVAATLVLTRLWYPSHVSGLEQFASRESWLVFSRDALLLALLGTLVWPEIYRLIASRANRAPSLSSGAAPSLSAPALIDGRP